MHLHRRVNWLLPGLLVSAIATPVIACSSATTAADASRCLLSATDSALIAAGVHTECSVEQRARPMQTPLMGTPTLSPSSGLNCVQADVQFVVDARGVPEPATIKVLRTNYTQFGDFVKQSVPSWRFRPALVKGQPVRQLVRHGAAVRAVRVVTTSGGRPSQPANPPRCP